MHEAFTFQIVQDKPPLEVTALCYFDNTLLIGTKDGVLLIYEINDDSSFNVFLIDSRKDFVKKEIKALCVIKEINILICQSDNQLYLFDLSTYQLITQLSKLQGVTLFDIYNSNSSSTEENKNGMIIKIALAIRKKLIIYQWIQQKFQKIKELNLSHNIKTISWGKEYTLCVGFSRNYAFVDLKTDTIDYFSLGSSLLDLTSFTSVKSSRILTISMPKNQFLLTKDDISTYIAETGQPIKSNTIKWSSIPTQIVFMHPYLIALLPQKIEIRTYNNGNFIQELKISSSKIILANDILFSTNENNIYSILPIDFDNQLIQLLNNNSFSEALQFIDLYASIITADEKSSEIIRVRSMEAKYLFTKNKEYERAIGIFLSLEIDPNDVLQLYPILNSNEEIIKLKNNKNDNLDQLKSLNCLIHFLTEQRSRLTKQRLYLYSIQSRSSIPKSISNSTISSYLSTTMSEISLSTIVYYRQLSLPDVEALSEVIDTALFKVYMIINDALIGPLLRVQNNCNLKVCESLLLDQSKYSELIDLYCGKNLHEKALDILIEKGSIPEEPLFGPYHIITYLQKLSKRNFDLILKYSVWVIEHYPEESLEIFTYEKFSSEERLRTIVVRHLEKYSKEICIKYLDYIINKLHDKTSEFHNKLALFYLEKLLNNDNTDEEKDECKKRLLEFLEQSNSYMPNVILAKMPKDSLYEERAVLLSHLGEHQKALSIYFNQLNSPQMAEKYCLKYYDPENEKVKNVFFILIQIHLENTKNSEITNEVLELLNKYGAYIDATKVIELFPEVTRISKLGTYFEKFFQEIMNRKHNQKIVYNLLKSEQLQVREQLMNYQSQSIRITDERVCKKCLKRIGTSVFIRDSDNSVLHYGCMKIQNNPSSSSLI